MEPIAVDYIAAEAIVVAADTTTAKAIAMASEAIAAEPEGR